MSPGRAAGARGPMALKLSMAASVTEEDRSASAVTRRPAALLPNFPSASTAANRTCSSRSTLIAPRAGIVRSGSAAILPRAFADRCRTSVFWLRRDSTRAGTAATCGRPSAASAVAASRAGLPALRSLRAVREHRNGRQHDLGRLGSDASPTETGQARDAWRRIAHERDQAGRCRPVVDGGDPVGSRTLRFVGRPSTRSIRTNRRSPSSQVISSSATTEYRPDRWVPSGAVRVHCPSDAPKRVEPFDEPLVVLMHPRDADRPDLVLDSPTLWNLNSPA